MGETLSIFHLRVLIRPSCSSGQNAMGNKGVEYYIAKWVNYTASRYELLQGYLFRAQDRAVAVGAGFLHTGGRLLPVAETSLKETHP